jgi:hypothetical protein
MILAWKRQYLPGPGHDHGTGPELAAIMVPGRGDHGRDGAGAG